MTNQLDELLLHPVRMRIALALARGQRTPKQIGEVLGDVTHATLYRHLKKLEQAGILCVTDERQARGAIEKTYALVSDELDLSEELRAASDDELLRHFLVFLLTNLKEFGTYLERREPDTAHDFSMQSMVLTLNKREYKAFMRDFMQLARRHADKGRTGRRREATTVSLVTIPRKH